MNLYVAYHSTDFVTQVNLDTLTRVSAIDLTPGGGGDYGIDAIVIGDSLYLARDCWPGSIIRVDLPTFAETGRCLVAEGWLGSGAPHALAYFNDILYVVIDDPPGEPLGGVIRINVPTMTQVDRLDLNARWPVCPIIDGNFLYVPHSLTSGELRRITLVPFALNATINLSTQYARCSVIEGTNLYIGHDISPAVITKVDLITFTETITETFDVGENWCWSIVSDGTYLYCGLASAGEPGIIVRVDIATFTRVDALTLPLAERDIWNLYIYNNQLWALCETAPTNVVRIDIPTFTRVGGLQLDPSEYDAWAGALWLPPVPPSPPPSLPSKPSVITLPATGVS